jgi:hypothetical protein
LRSKLPRVVTKVSITVPLAGGGTCTGAGTSVGAGGHRPTVARWGCSSTALNRRCGQNDHRRRGDEKPQFGRIGIGMDLGTLAHVGHIELDLDNSAVAIGQSDDGRTVYVGPLVIVVDAHIEVHRYLGLVRYGGVAQQMHLYQITHEGAELCLTYPESDDLRPGA